MVFYSTNGDQELTYLKYSLAPPVVKNIVSTKEMWFSLVHIGQCSICCDNIIQTGGAWFSVFQTDTKLQLLIYHHEDRRYMVFYSNICSYRTNRDHAQAAVITS